MVLSPLIRMRGSRNEGMGVGLPPLRIMPVDPLKAFLFPLLVTLRLEGLVPKEVIFLTGNTTLILFKLKSCDRFLIILGSLCHWTNKLERNLSWYITFTTQLCAPGDSVLCVGCSNGSLVFWLLVRFSKQEVPAEALADKKWSHDIISPAPAELLQM